MPLRKLVMCAVLETAVALALCGSLSYGQAVDNRLVYKRVAGAVVLVLANSSKESGSSRQGTGVIVSEDGRILSALHVVEGASRATIKLKNGDVYDDVRVVAFDKRRDLVVLKVPGFGLPRLTLGNSDDVQAGGPVVLVSNPLGLERSVSQGIISGVRVLEEQGYKVFQTTAPASPGSSGGAILNSKGELIAIATSKLEGGENLNFGIPVNYARGMLPGEESLTLPQLTA